MRLRLRTLLVQRHDRCFLLNQHPGRDDHGPELRITRQQILGVVALEGLSWTALGALAGLALGLAVSVVLVHVVNPQSFHWTMDLLLPWGRLALLCSGHCQPRCCSGHRQEQPRPL